MTSIATNEDQATAESAGKAEKQESSDFHCPPRVPGKRRSIKELKGCLVGLVPPPTKEEIRQAVEAEEQFNSRKPGVLNLPPHIPDQRCSIKDTKGCLADREVPPMTVEEMKQVVKKAVVQRYLRTFA